MCTWIRTQMDKFPSTNSLDITCYGCVSRESVLFMMHIAGCVTMFLFVYECCVFMLARMHASHSACSTSAHCYCSFLSSSASSFAIFYLPFFSSYIHASLLLIFFLKSLSSFGPLKFELSVKTITNFIRDGILLKTRKAEVCVCVCINHCFFNICRPMWFLV